MRNCEIFEERESKTLEIKSALPKFDTLIKTCIAFANGTGGTIVIGVEDETRAIIGVSEAIRKRVFDEFPNSLFDSTSPPLLAQIYERAFTQESVIMIHIPPSQKKPCFQKKEGIPKGVYLRVGSNTRRASEEYIEDLIRESKRMFYDEEMIHEPINVLSKDLLKSYFHTAQSKRRLLAEKIITQSHANAERYCPTVTGTLHFCDSPDDYIPEATIICSQFQGTSGREIIQTQEISGPLLEQADVSFRLVESWVSRHFKLQGIKLLGKLLLPKEALREAIVNALIHRKYFIPGSVKIALYDNRLEIFSPGGFPGLVDINHLGDGTTFLRNPNIARIARKMGMIEKMGSGIKLILDSFKKANLRKPEFHEEGDFVKVVFYFEKIKNPKHSDKEALIKLAKERGELTISSVMHHLNISRNTATRRLVELVHQKVLIRRGKGPSVRYLLSENC